MNRKVLGRGLSALISEDNSNSDNEGFLEMIRLN
jgi:hypothetical protein